MCVHMSTYECVHIHVHVCVHTCACMRVWCVYVCVCVGACCLAIHVLDNTLYHKGKAPVDPVYHY